MCFPDLQLLLPSRRVQCNVKKERERRERERQKFHRKQERGKLNCVKGWAERLERHR